MYMLALIKSKYPGVHTKDFISLLGTLCDGINEQNTEIHLRMFIFNNKNHQPAVFIIIIIIIEHTSIFIDGKNTADISSYFSIISVDVYTSCAAICLLASRGLTRTLFFFFLLQS